MNSGIGILTVKYGSFNGNSADWVCIIAPHSQCPIEKDCPRASCILAPHFELIDGCTCSPQGGAIYSDYGATCNIDGGTFVSNTAGYVSQQRKKPPLTSPFARKRLELLAQDIEQF
jgi:hypothetical protein